MSAQRQQPVEGLRSGSATSGSSDSADRAAPQQQQQPPRHIRPGAVQGGDPEPLPEPSHGLGAAAAIRAALQRQALNPPSPQAAQRAGGGGDRSQAGGGMPAGEGERAGHGKRSAAPEASATRQPAATAAGGRGAGGARAQLQGQGSGMLAGAPRAAGPPEPCSSTGRGAGGPRAQQAHHTPASVPHGGGRVQLVPLAAGLPPATAHSGEPSLRGSKTKQGLAPRKEQRRAAKRPRTLQHRPEAGESPAAGHQAQRRHVHQGGTSPDPGGAPESTGDDSGDRSTHGSREGHEHESDDADDEDEALETAATGRTRGSSREDTWEAGSSLELVRATAHRRQAPAAHSRPDTRRSPHAARIAAGLVRPSSPAGLATASAVVVGSGGGSGSDDPPAAARDKEGVLRRGRHKGRICAHRDCNKFARLSSTGVRRYCIQHMRDMGLQPKEYSRYPAGHAEDDEAPEAEHGSMGPGAGASPEDRPTHGSHSVQHGQHGPALPRLSSRTIVKQEQHPGADEAAAHRRRHGAGSGAAEGDEEEPSGSDPCAHLRAPRRRRTQQLHQQPSLRDPRVSHGPPGAPGTQAATTPALREGAHDVMTTLVAPGGLRLHVPTSTLQQAGLMQLQAAGPAASPRASQRQLGSMASPPLLPPGAAPHRPSTGPPVQVQQLLGAPTRGSGHQLPAPLLPRGSESAAAGSGGDNAAPGPAPPDAAAQGNPNLASLAAPPHAAGAAERTSGRGTLSAEAGTGGPSHAASSLPPATVAERSSRAEDTQRVALRVVNVDASLLPQVVAVLTAAGQVGASARQGGPPAVLVQASGGVLLPPPPPDGHARVLLQLPSGEVVPGEMVQLQQQQQQQGLEGEQGAVSAVMGLLQQLIGGEAAGVTGQDVIIPTGLLDYIGGGVGEQPAQHTAGQAALHSGAAGAGAGAAGVPGFAGDTQEVLPVLGGPGSVAAAWRRQQQQQVTTAPKQEPGITEMGDPGAAPVEASTRGPAHPLVPPSLAASYSGTNRLLAGVGSGAGPRRQRSPQLQPSRQAEKQEQRQRQHDKWPSQGATDLGTSLSYLLEQQAPGGVVDRPEVASGAGGQLSANPRQLPVVAGPVGVHPTAQATELQQLALAFGLSPEGGAGPLQLQGGALPNSQLQLNSSDSLAAVLQQLYMQQQLQQQQQASIDAEAWRLLLGGLPSSVAQPLQQQPAAQQQQLRLQLPLRLFPPSAASLDPQQQQQQQAAPQGQLPALPLLGLRSSSAFGSLPQLLGSDAQGLGLPQPGAAGLAGAASLSSQQQQAQGQGQARTTPTLDLGLGSHGGWQQQGM